MRRRKTLLLALVLPVLSAGMVWATIFGNVRGIVHDPQHRPVGSAEVVLKALRSDWSHTTETSAEGEFEFNAVPLGDYTISISAPGFEPS